MTVLALWKRDEGRPPRSRLGTATLLLWCLSTVSVATAWTCQPRSTSTVARRGSECSSSRLLAQSDADDRTKARRAWKEKIRAVAFRTRAGFDATATDRQRMTYLIQQLAICNPTAEPAATYYATSSSSIPTDSTSPTLAGKWTLIYTDAPDILSLANGGGGGQLDAIGQECAPPYIRNVIAWRRPAWASMLARGDEDNNNNNYSDPRLLQKVVTQASATPDEPTRVNLVLQGLEFSAAENPSKAENVEETRAATPWPMNWLLSQKSLQLSGPASLPFGSFTILYLDDELRIVRTNSGYYAMNERNTAATEWF